MIDDGDFYIFDAICIKYTITTNKQIKETSNLDTIYSSDREKYKEQV